MAPYLGAFNHRIKHLPGASNTWPNTMTRWMRGYQKSSAIRRVEQDDTWAPVAQSRGESDRVKERMTNARYMGSKIIEVRVFRGKSNNGQ